MENKIKSVLPKGKKYYHTFNDESEPITYDFGIHENDTSVIIYVEKYNNSEYYINIDFIRISTGDVLCNIYEEITTLS